MTLNESSYLVRFHLQAEEDAIDAYTKFYELIKDVDTVLADEIKEILTGIDSRSYLNITKMEEVFADSFE